MADLKLTQARTSAAKLREGYLRHIARLPTGITADDLRDASELLLDLVAMIETFTPPPGAAPTAPTKEPV